jgi:hypothetical protein
MNSAIGRAKTRPIGAAKPDGVGRYPSAGPAVAVDKLGRLGRRGDDSIENPEAPELARGVGREGHRRADFREFVCLLVDVGAKTALPERKPKSKTTDAGSDNRDPGRAMNHIHEAAM